MNTFNPNHKIGDMVSKYPKAADIFKYYKIDFCCGGNRPLQEAIQEQGLNESEILERLNNSYEEFKNTLGNKEKDWMQAPLDELVDHIVNVHHAYLYENLPEISGLITKILRVHGDRHPELSKVHRLFHTLKMELEEHLIKEETIQYPAIQKYITSKSLEDLERAIKVIGELEEEHTGAGDILKRLRQETNEYEEPKDGCDSYNASFVKLQELESDLFQHIHLENNILFPRLYALKK